MRSFLLIAGFMLAALGCKEGGQKRSSAASDFDSSRSSADAVGKQAIGSTGEASEDESQFEQVLTDDELDGDELNARQRKKNKSRPSPDLDGGTPDGDLDDNASDQEPADDMNADDGDEASSGEGDSDQSAGDTDDMDLDLPEEDCVDASASLHSKKKKFKRGKRKHGRKFVNRVLRQFDDDGDRKIDRRELSDVLMFIKTIVFDGFVDGKRAKKPRHKAPPIPTFNKLLKCFDEDGDKMLSRKEWNLQRNSKKRKACFGEDPMPPPPPKNRRCKGPKPPVDGDDPVLVVDPVDSEDEADEGSDNGTPAQTK